MLKLATSSMKTMIRGQTMILAEEGSSPWPLSCCPVLGVGGGDPGPEIHRNVNGTDGQNDGVAKSCTAKQEEETHVKSSVTSTPRDIHASIASKARYFSYILDEAVKSEWKCRLKANTTLVDVLQNANLGKAVMELSGGRKVFVKCLLMWAEPMVWALERVRWSIPMHTQTSAMGKRQTSMSWEEVAIFFSILTNRAIGPRYAPLLMCAAIAKHM